MLQLLLLLHQPPYRKTIIDRVAAARKEKYPYQKLKWTKRIIIINTPRKLWDCIVILQFSTSLYNIYYAIMGPWKN